MKTHLSRWLFLLVMLSGLIACTSRPVSPSATPEATVVAPLKLGANVGVEEARAVYRNPGVTIVDVRERDEYNAGHIPGALLIPLSELPQRLKDMPRDTEVILVCRSGNRSQQAYDYLKQQGFTNIHNLVGGMRAWQAAGYEIEP